MNAQFPAPADAAPAPRRPVVLIGPMAAGKSFLALHMSKFYGYDFVDADQVGSIHTSHVRTTLSADQAADLPPPDGSNLVEITPSRSMGDRLGRLFGRRRR